MVMTSFSYLNRKKCIIIFKILSAFQVKELNFGENISKGFIKHQIRREKVIWEVENNNPNSFSPRKKCWRGYINAAVRVWSGEYVQAWASAWFRNPFPWRRDTDLYFVRLLSNFIHKCTIMRWRILLIFGHRVNGYLWHFVFETLWVWYRLLLCAQSFRNFTNRLFMTRGGILLIWGTGFEAKVNRGTLPKTRCGHDAGYRLCPITLKVHAHVVND